MRSFFNIVAEAATVLAAATLFAVVLNSVRPNGIQWGRDYFPESSKTAEPPDPTLSPVERMLGGKANGIPNTMAEEKSSEFSFIHFDEMQREFLENQGLTLFLDARNEKSFLEGHVPGAWLFDHYHFEKYVNEVLPMCLASDKVIVYCTGGDCEDSLFACKDLAQLGVPAEKLFIFEGGILEWKEQGMDVELGPRDSGIIESP
jgi:rhodanese-related sulfurtransferase